MASYRSAVYNGRRQTHSPASHNPAYRRDEHLPAYPSADPTLSHFNPLAQSRPSCNVYTGAQVTGVALLHKQAYVPVTAHSPTNNDPKRGV